MWPDFMLEKIKGWDGFQTFEKPFWRATTCTMRPPVRAGRGQEFAIILEIPHDVDEAVVRGRAWDRFVSVYSKAHPDDCAGTFK